MKHIKKIGGINLVLLTIYMLLVNLTASGGEAGLEVLLIAAMLIGLQVLLNFAVSIVLFIKKDPRASAFMLSAVLVLLVGFSACLASAALY